MCASIRHRGPDDQGTRVEGHVGLGMRRLSVIDLDTGDQPISNEDGSIVVVFNGEIYNFQDIRRDLEQRGHRFQTQSDTEVIPHLYEEYGEACVDRLRGMFAFALWDAKRQVLLLARDRLGVKPLYYYHDGRRLIFGSEIKAILQDPGVPRSADPRALDDMLTYGYVVPPRTCFQGICELPPGTLLRYAGGTLSTKPYWDLEFRVAEPYDEAASAERLLALLRESVRLRMISDVPIGALLSGGIDSSLVVALMSELASGPVRTFSIGFQEREFSELPLARQVAEAFGAEHHEYIVEPDVIDILPTLVSHYDSPFLDTSAIPTYYVSKMARENVKVVLSGDGGDELFAGYNVYLADKVASRLSVLPPPLWRAAGRAADALIPGSARFARLRHVLREFIESAGLGPEARYARWVSKVKAGTRQDLYAHGELLERLDGVNDNHLGALFAMQPQADPLNRMLYVNTKSILPNDILAKVDRMSMALGLEVRSPLLDYKLFEFAARLPARAKLKGLKTKYLLKKVAAGVLPASILKQPKRGFSVPLDTWMRGALAPYMQEILTDPGTRARGYFRAEAVDRMIRAHLAGERQFGRDLWTLVTIELWFRMYIDRFEIALDPDNQSVQENQGTKEVRMKTMQGEAG